MMHVLLHATRVCIPLTYESITSYAKISWSYHKQDTLVKRIFAFLYVHVRHCIFGQQIYSSGSCMHTEIERKT